MKIRFTTSLMLAAFVCATMNAQSTEQLLLSGWRFEKGAHAGAESTTYNDTKWQQVTIPHDWAISGPFDKEIDKQVVAIVQNGEKEATEKTGRSGSLPWIGEGWYRTTITIPEGYSHAELVFDGAMAEPRVYIDGKEVGYWAFGYNTFKLDISDALPRDRSVEGKLIPGEHTLAVHLQNVEESSRWYPGAGLYRPVRLVLGQAVGLETWGTFARTTRLDEVNANGTAARRALLTVNAKVRKHDVIKGNYSIVHKLVDAQGRQVASVNTSINESYETCQVIPVADAALWSPEHPVLYTLVTELLDGDKLIDRSEIKTGLRLTEYTAEGFKLNGQIRKFKGVCLHHDMGPVGAAFNKAAFRRQVRLLQEIGCDAIRTSHNMPAPWQMDICDEMGMLVMAESCDMWVYPKCKNGYARFFEQVDTESPNADGRAWWERDFENLVLVHRNHPSIVMWSIGNEIPDQSSATGLKYTRKLQNLIHSLDPTRPCTQGNDNIGGAIWSGVLSATEIPGFNYRVQQYEKGLAASPRGFILGSETASTVSSRGVYHFPVVERHGVAEDAMPDGQVSSYDLQSCIWSNIPDDDWMWQDKAPWVIGEFVWTGFDYLGEPTPYDEYWPSRSSYFGIYDLAGLPKDRAWLYRTHWAPEKETIHLLPHWNWQGREGEVTPVFCYTNYPEAELFVNGKSQGRRRHIDLSLEDYKALMTDVKTPWGEMAKFADPDAPQGKNRLDRYRMRWMDVKFEPGEVKVVAYDAQGNKAAERVVRTAGKPHHIELVADRNTLTVLPVDDSGKALDTPDLSFVTVRVVDKDGNLCPAASNQLSFAVKGASARFNSCCNGDATSTEVFTSPTMKAFNGQLVVVVEATATPGQATLTVTAPGLKKAVLPITIK
ncbi:MAG: DUF4982 domain-containing protein [Bacteroidales bacterium]|nr:DUF4982 domain-containing protein [Candidatus Sodaliphilus limicaballi]